jgi:hypothetical protein
LGSDGKAARLGREAAAGGGVNFLIVTPAQAGMTSDNYPCLSLLSAGAWARSVIP